MVAPAEEDVEEGQNVEIQEEQQTEVEALPQPRDPDIPPSGRLRTTEEAIYPTDCGASGVYWDAAVGFTTRDPTGPASRL